jgi:hypothetical protein
MRHTIRPLDASTWAAFAELAERNNGIFGWRGLDAGPHTICWHLEHHHQVKVSAPASQTACAARVYQMCR